MPSSVIRRRKTKTKGIMWTVVFEFRDPATGKRATRSRTFATQREAKTWLAEQNERRRKAGEYRKPSTMTLGAFLDEWAEGLAGKVAVSTARSYTEICRIYLKPHLAAVPLADLSTAGLQRFIDGLYSEKGLSATTVRYVGAVLNIALKRAVALGLLPVTPTAGIEPPKKVEAESPAAMNPEEAARFVAALDGEQLRPLFITLLFTGIRPSEAFALRWIDLDLGDDPTLSVNRALQRSQDGEAIFAAPKTKRSRRTLPLGPVADLAAVMRLCSRSAAARCFVGEE